MASLSCYAVHVQKHIEAILKKGRMGLSPGTVKISNGMPSCPPYVENAACDRFKLTIPYAGHTVSWDVIFYSNKPEVAPDLIFVDETFAIELEQIPALNFWDSRNSNGLLDIIHQVLEIYRRQQTIQLSRHSRVHFEYMTVVQQEGFCENDIEVYVSPKNRGPVSFLIRLPMDFSQLPPLLVLDNPDEDSVLLLVTFHTPEGSRVTPQLFLSPKVEQAIGGALDWRLPNLTTDSCLMDYVPTLINILHVKITQVIESFKSRKEYVTIFLSHFESNLLEYDVEAFTKISFLLEYNNFFFILHIELTNSFPIDKPNFIFQSIYHKVSGKPYTITVEFPYSPRWSIHEMFERAKRFIMEHASEFEATLKPRIKM